MHYVKSCRNLKSLKIYCLHSGHRTQKVTAFCVELSLDVFRSWPKNKVWGCSEEKCSNCWKSSKTKTFTKGEWTGINYWVQERDVKEREGRTEKVTVENGIITGCESEDKNCTRSKSNGHKKETTSTSWSGLKDAQEVKQTTCYKLGFWIEARKLKWRRPKW